MKDFYDLHALAVQFSYEGAQVVRAIEATFKRRRTPFKLLMPAALTHRFYIDNSRNGQWRAYCLRNNLPGAPLDFSVIGETLISFLAPIWRAIKDQTKFDLTWPPGGPWKLAGKG